MNHSSKGQELNEGDVVVTREVPVEGDESPLLIGTVIAIGPVGERQKVHLETSPDGQKYERLIGQVQKVTI